MKEQLLLINKTNEVFNLELKQETVLKGTFLKGRVNEKDIEFHVQFEVKPPSSPIKMTRRQFLTFADEVEIVRKAIVNRNI